MLLSLSLHKFHGQKHGANLKLPISHSDNQKAAEPKPCRKLLGFLYFYFFLKNAPNNPVTDNCFGKLKTVTSLQHPVLAEETLQGLGITASIGGTMSAHQKRSVRCIYATHMQDMQYVSFIFQSLSPT